MMQERGGGLESPEEVVNEEDEESLWFLVLEDETLFLGRLTSILAGILEDVFNEVRIW